MDVKALAKELAEAYPKRQSRAAFGSIARRHVEELSTMNGNARAAWIRAINVPASYVGEVAKEISVWKYNRERGE